MKLPEVKPTLADRVVGWISPKKGAERLQYRMAMALSGGYKGASKSRRALETYNAPKGSPDATLLDDLPTLRERSRDLVRNSPLAAGAIHTKVTNIVGTGLRLQSRVDGRILGLSDDQVQTLRRQIESEWRLWSDSKECDAERSMCFADLQELAFRQTLECGDEFVGLPMIRRGNFPYRLKVRLVEGDRVSNPDHQPDTETLRAGVVKDSNGAATSYHVADHHPGSYGRFDQGTQWRKIPAYTNSGRPNMLHLFFKMRPGQSRGAPDLAPVIEALKQLEEYSDAELMAAVVSAMFTVFVKTDGGTGMDIPQEPTSETGGKASDKAFKLAPGAVVELFADESIETANPGRPNDKFDPFVQAILRQIGVALELPFELLVKHFTASYSAAQAALLEAWKYFRKRRQWLARNFCQPIFEVWFEEAVLRGRIAAPGFVNGDPAVRRAYMNCQWIGDDPGHIDPIKAVNAAKERHALGVSSLSRETLWLTGEDWEEVQEQREREQQRTGVTDEPST